MSKPTVERGHERAGERNRPREDTKPATVGPCPHLAQLIATQGDRRRPLCLTHAGPVMLAMSLTDTAVDVDVTAACLVMGHGTVQLCSFYQLPMSAPEALTAEQVRAIEEYYK